MLRASSSASVALLVLVSATLVSSGLLKNPDTPTLEHRSTHPDRLWLSDHSQAPAVEAGFYSISNDNGTTAAYWRLRPGSPPVAPIGVELSSDVSGPTLEPRLPSWVNIYRSPDEVPCDEFLTQITNPRSGQCYGAWNFALPNSIYIPSAVQGDIFNLYSDASCGSFVVQLYQYVGCFYSYVNFESLWPCNICN